MYAPENCLYVLACQIWMTRLVKYVLQVKSRVSKENEDRLIVLNKRIAEVINQNRMNSLKSIGARE